MKVTVFWEIALFGLVIGTNISNKYAASVFRAACFEMLVHIYQITWRHIPGDCKLQIINWKNVTYVIDLSILNGI
jgi:hypothetical protein